MAMNSELSESKDASSPKLIYCSSSTGVDLEEFLVDNWQAVHLMNQNLGSDEFKVSSASTIRKNSIPSYLWQDSSCQLTTTDQEQIMQNDGAKSFSKNDNVEDTTQNASIRRPCSKQSKNYRQDDASENDYIHIRAKRGQATNSHSLAERIRRERISERMRLLQDLVPGCSKITGKAMMLDEIINYVQALQQQVEFLSMKLATIKPEFNFDLENLPSKQIYHPSHRNPLNYLQCAPEFMQRDVTVCNLASTGYILGASIPQISPLEQHSNMWFCELQDVPAQKDANG